MGAVHSRPSKSTQNNLPKLLEKVLTPEEWNAYNLFEQNKIIDSAKEIEQLFRENYLSSDDVNTLNKHYNIKGLFDFLEDNNINPDQWKTYSLNQKNILSNKSIQRLIKDEFLTLDEAINLDENDNFIDLVDTDATIIGDYDFNTTIETFIPTFIKNKLFEDGYLTLEEARTLNDEDEALLVKRIPKLIKDGYIKKPTENVVTLQTLPDVTVFKGTSEEYRAVLHEEKLVETIPKITQIARQATLEKTMTCFEALQLPDEVLRTVSSQTVKKHILEGHISILDLKRQYEARKGRLFAYEDTVYIDDNLKSEAFEKLVNAGCFCWSKALYISEDKRKILEMPGVVDLIISKQDQLKNSNDPQKRRNRRVILADFRSNIYSMPKRILKELESKELRDIIIAGKLSLDQIEGFSKLPEMIKETTIQHIQDLIEKDPVAAFKFIEKIYPPQREENLEQVKYDLNAVHNEMYPLIVKAMVATERSTSIHEKEDVISKITERQDNYRKCKSYLTSRLWVPRTLRDYLKKLDIVYPTVALDKNTLDGLKTKTFNTANNKIIKRDFYFQRNHGSGLFNTQPQEKGDQPLLLLEDIKYP